ncbi:peptidoglycan-binding domain-containing protein [Micromonospora sp. NPDC047527]|uniref:peptidoglycan-binding domain-containing protein n=1 Tax=unclassified Micromonospora TaxID=2617518 RepID=UPI0033F72BE3
MQRSTIGFGFDQENNVTGVSRWRSRRGLQAVIGTVGAVALLTAMSLVLGSQLRSPEQAAADAAPPTASLITVPAELRVLSQPVVLRGRVVAGASRKIKPPGPAIGPNSVVTSVPVKNGQSIKEGKVLLVVTGQPVIALNLAFPLYRDLVGGVRGPDVSEVQRALSRLGYRVRVSGTFDRSTQSAVGRLFKDRGFEASPGKAEAAAALPAARAAVGQAQASLEKSVAANTGVADAKAVLKAAQTTLATTEREAGPSLRQAGVIRIGSAGTVTKVLVRVGHLLDKPDAALFEVDGSAAYVVAAASRDQIDLITAGQPASIADEATGRTAAGTIRQIATEPSNDQELGLSGFIISVTFTGEAMAPIADRTVRVDLAAAASDTPVLVVPVASVYSRADGSTFVTVLRPNNTIDDVTVSAGRVAGGWAEVTPQGTGTLTAGDRVVVGQGNQG